MSVFLGSCASNLKTETDLKAAPDDLSQKIEDYDLSQAVAATETPTDIAKVDASAAAEVKDESTVSLKETSKKKKSKKEILAPDSDTNEPTKAKKIVTKTAVAPKPPGPATWTPSGWPYGIGETAKYSLRWGLIEGGVVTMTVLPPKSLDGEPVLHYLGTVKSSKALDIFYKVDDSIQSWVGLRDHLPRRQEIKQLESAQWGKRVVVFDQKAKIAKYYSAGTHRDKGPFEVRQDDPVAFGSQDIFAALYFYRFIPSLENTNFPIHDRFKNWNNKMTFLGRETIDVQAGRFNTMRFKMLPRVSGQLEPKGDVEIWLKDDSSRVMVQFKAKIKVGSITGELLEYQQGSVPTLSPPAMVTPTKLNDMGEM